MGEVYVVRRKGQKPRIAFRPDPPQPEATYHRCRLCGGTEKREYWQQGFGHPEICRQCRLSDTRSRRGVRRAFDIAGVDLDSGYLGEDAMMLIRMIEHYGT